MSKKPHYHEPEKPAPAPAVEEAPVPVEEAPVSVEEVGAAPQLPTLYEVVSRNIKQARMRTGFTHREIAQVLDRGEDEVAGWEDPERGIPSLLNLEKLGIVLGVPPYRFFERREL